MKAQLSCFLRLREPEVWRQETQHLARSGTTLASNQLLQLVIPFVTTAMTGRLGVDALAAGSIVSSIGFLLFITGLGVMQGLIPPVSNSLSTGDQKTAVRTIRGGLIAAVAMGVGATAIMSIVPSCLRRTALDPALVAVVQRFIDALILGYLPSIVAIALRFFLIAVNDLKCLNSIITAGTAFNVTCNLALASEWAGLDGVTAIGVTITLTNWVIFGLLLIAMWRSQRIPKGVFDPRAGFALGDALKLGIPVGAILFTETLLFTGSSVLMGYFGNVELAAHGIVMLWLNFALMIPIGISQAAMARVASLHGQRDAAAIRYAVLISLAAGSAISIVTGVLLVALSDSLVLVTMWSRSSASEAVVEAARSFFQYCAITQFLSGLVIIMASILRGLRDANAVLWLVMLGYWGIGLGGAVLLAFMFGLGGAGIWIGITLAFAFSVMLLAVKFWHAIFRSGAVPAYAAPPSSR